MFLNTLFEALDKKHASFCFGRMNPPTVGHKQLIDTVANSAQGGDYFIFASQTQDKKKNPLNWSQKVNYLTKLFPEHAAHIVKDPEVKTIMDAIHWLYAHGYREVTLVAGSDRLPSFQELLPKYNGVEGTNGAYYKFDKINFASSGERDPDADGVAGVSASGAREAAKAGDFASFQQNIGTKDTKLAQNLYNDVRSGMNIVDEATIGSRLGFDKQLQMHKMKADLAKTKPAQQAKPADVVKKTPQVPHTVTPAEQQAKIARLNQLLPIKREIEKLKARATRKAGYLPRGLAADLEDYYTLDDVDTHFDEMLAAYQKQLNALEQYLQMRKTVWTPKKAVQESALDDPKFMEWVAWSNNALAKLIQTVRAIYDPKNADILEQYLAHQDNVDWLVATTKHWIKPGTWTEQENEWFHRLDDEVGHYAALYEFAREPDTLKDEIIPFWKEFKKEHGISLNSIRQHFAMGQKPTVHEDSQADRNARIIAGELEDARTQNKLVLVKHKEQELHKLGYYLDKHGKLQRMGMYEEAAGVGVVASNKKMAKDPRYSTSMTQDVRPDTPRKNAKAFKLV